LIRFVGYDVVLPGVKVADETADVIVVYLDFPQRSTIGKIRALRADQRITDIPIIVFLPWKIDEGALAALEAGGDDLFDVAAEFDSTGFAPCAALSPLWVLRKGFVQSRDH
jgi:CheY-like chemotaxis protein